MALAPKFSGLQLSQNLPTGKGFRTQDDVRHTLELYLDYTCPFSAKLFNTIYNNANLRTTLTTTPHLRVILRPLIQPWHPSSTLVHEAALAVQRLAPESFWDYSALLFAHQKEFFDVNVVNETRNQTYKRLAALAAEAPVGLDKDEVYGLLEISDKAAEDGGLNTGNKITNDLKLLVRQSRVVGVHVTPTVFFDGIEKGEISSGWSVEQWTEWLAQNVGIDPIDP